MVIPKGARGYVDHVDGFGALYMYILLRGHLTAHFKLGLFHFQIEHPMRPVAQWIRGTCSFTTCIADSYVGTHS